jgi:hypothetical protein
VIPLAPKALKMKPPTMAPTIPRTISRSRKAYTTQGLLGLTVPYFWVYNPAYAHVQNEHVWQAAWADIMQRGTKPQDAADKAFKRSPPSVLRRALRSGPKAVSNFFSAPSRSSSVSPGFAISSEGQHIGHTVPKGAIHAQVGRGLPAFRAFSGILSVPSSRRR